MRSALSFVVLLLAGCGASPMNDYALHERALSEAQAKTMPSKDAAAAGVERFKAFYADFSPGTLKKLTREVYAADAFFADPLRQVRGIEEIEAYFLRAAGAIEGWSLVFEDESVRGPHHYYRWRMSYRIRRNGKEVRLLGMSHVLYDAQGKVSFHQDYYDGAEAVYEKLPVLGWLIRKVRSRI